MSAGVAFAGAGLAFVVARDGTVVWQAIPFTVVALLALAAFRLVRPPGSTSAASAFAFGAVTMPVGLGYSIQHLDKAPLSWGSIAGLAVFAGGLVLVGSGAWQLFRGTGRWMRIPVGLGLLAVIFVFGWVLAQAVAATNVPRTDLGTATPADRGLSYRDVQFETVDGVTLSGWYIPSHNGAAVALLHGSGSTRSDVLDHAVVLAEQGYGVLLYDARGHGRSDGRAMDLGWFGDEDLTGAVSFLVGRPEVDPIRIAAVGMSMGGEQAVGAAATDPRLAAVVAEGATGRITGDNDWLSERYGWRGAIQERIDWVQYSVTDLLTSADQPIDLREAVAESAPRPVLLVAAGSVPTEQHAGSFIQSGSPDTVDLWVVPDSGHIGGLRTEPAEWTVRVTEFLDAATGDVRLP